jgi:hypothetical protein
MTVVHTYFYIVVDTQQGCQTLKKIKNFYKPSNTKFHEKRSSGSRVVSYGHTDMTKLIVAFRNFGKRI